ncbi:MAG: DUF2190 family protein [Anaerotignum sp.]|nr:DUF2190 family protein [Anaerotignum sp.]
MGILGKTHNESPTIAMVAGVDFAEDVMVAVKVGDEGVVPCDTAGEVAFGVVIPGQGSVAKGNPITVLIKDIGLMTSAATIKAGQAVATDKSGKAVVATAGQFIIGYATVGAEEAGDVASIQITKSGYAV